MPYGLTNEQLATIKTIIANYPEIQKVILFGSCATDSHQAIADINLAISGDNLPADLSTKLKAQLKQETNIAVVDVIDYEQITSKKLLQHIDDCGVVVCQQGNNEWVEYKLADIAIISTKTWKPGDSKEKYIGLEHIIENRLRIDHIGCSTTVSSNKYIFNNGQILFGKLRPYFRKIIKPKFSGICSTDIWVINSKKVADATFLFYFLANQEFVDISYASSGGTRMPRANWKFLAQTKWMIPPLPEQQAIAEVLSSLDDKIDLLHRQNKTLEDMAQTLFRQWFIEEAQDDWEEVKLGDILSSIESGKRPKGGIDPNLKRGIASVGAESIDGIGKFNFSSTKYITHEFYSKMKKGRVKSYDVLIYKDGAYVGKKAMFGNGFPFDEFAINEHVFILRGNKKVTQIFLYFLLDQEELSLLNSNSAQPGLNQKSMKNFDVIIPPFYLIKKFTEKAKLNIDKIFANQTQIQTLENLRDTHLPKLISGEVRVKY